MVFCLCLIGVAASPRSHGLLWDWAQGCFQSCWAQWVGHKEAKTLHGCKPEPNSVGCLVSSLKGRFWPADIAKKLQIHHVPQFFSTKSMKNDYNHSISFVFQKAFAIPSLKPLALPRSKEMLDACKKLPDLPADAYEQLRLQGEHCWPWGHLTPSYSGPKVFGNPFGNGDIWWPLQRTLC